MEGGGAHDAWAATRMTEPERRWGGKKQGEVAVRGGREGGRSQGG